MDVAPPLDLPDFCRWPRLLGVAGLAVAAVTVLALAPGDGPRWSWMAYAAATAFAVWIALASALLLCRLRPRLQRLPTLAAWAGALAIPAGFAAVAAWLLSTIAAAYALQGLTAPATDPQFIARTAAMSAVVAAVTLRYFGLQERALRQVRDLAQARADALQARIRPHFLFNSMNTIAALIRRQPTVAERAVEDLADLFRAALGSEGALSTLGEELALGERFIAIEQLRLGDRLRFACTCPDDVPRALPLPRLTLQPLLENAVLHGVAPRPDGGEIRLELRRDAGALVIALSNPLPNAPTVEAGNHHAQASVEARLRHHVGAGLGFSAGPHGGYYRVMIRLPLP
jgi:two-component system sensor histidine kinase AlgZ